MDREIHQEQEFCNVICTDCSGASFRLSRLRLSDVERLALLQYPVRCRNCHRRTFAGLPLALALYQARRAKRLQSQPASTQH